MNHEVVKGQEALTEVRNLSVDGAITLRETGVTIASEMKVAGFLTVYDRDGLELASQVVDKAKPLNVEIARAKIQTVLATQRSSSVQAKHMRDEDKSRDDFGGQLGSLFGGGVAIFADRELKEFVGAIAFSGGTQEEDEEIGSKAVRRLGLFTDIRNPELDTPLDLYNLTNRSLSALNGIGVHTLEDLARLTEEDLRRLSLPAYSQEEILLLQRKTFSS